FQAEDGIRDKLVTGVQTCALPISLIPVWTTVFLIWLPPRKGLRLGPCFQPVRPQSFPFGGLPAFRQEGAMVDSAGLVPWTASCRQPQGLRRRTGSQTSQSHSVALERCPANHRTEIARRFSCRRVLCFSLACWRSVW